MIGESNVVPLFKTFEELQSDEAEIIADFNAELDEATKLLELTFAALQDDGDALAKLDSADLTLAKSTADRLLAERRRQNPKFGFATVVALAKLGAKTAALTAVRDALLKRNRRLFGLDNLAKRSARHAAAMARSSAGN